MIFFSVFTLSLSASRMLRTLNKWYHIVHNCIQQWSSSDTHVRLYIRFSLDDETQKIKTEKISSDWCSEIHYVYFLLLLLLQVKIWFQNRRSKYKKMMKAAQGPSVGGSGGMPLGSQNPGSHSPNHQTMHSGGFLIKLSFVVVHGTEHWTVFVFHLIDFGTLIKIGLLNSLHRSSWQWFE